MLFRLHLHTHFVNNDLSDLYDPELTLKSKFQDGIYTHILLLIIWMIDLTIILVEK